MFPIGEILWQFRWGNDHTVGLKSDGTVMATNYTGDKRYYTGQCDVSGWKDIVAISAGGNYTVGLKSDGTVVATKYIGNMDYDGRCDVYDWREIVAISAGQSHTVGLKSDGTVVATKYIGKYYHGACDVSEWKLYQSDADKEAVYSAACKWQESGSTDALKRAVEIFKSLDSYKDSAERVKACSIPLLNAEKTSLQAEISNLKGIFSGRRRKQIEARLAEIEKELKKL